MATLSSPIDSPFLTAMRNTLEQQIHAELKGPLMQIAEEQIDLAVQQAVEALRPRVEAHLRQYDMSAEINLVIQRAAGPANPPSTERK